MCGCSSKNRWLFAIWQVNLELLNLVLFFNPVVERFNLHRLIVWHGKDVLWGGPLKSRSIANCASKLLEFSHCLNGFSPSLLSCLRVCLRLGLDFLSFFLLLGFLDLFLLGLCDWLGLGFFLLLGFLDLFLLGLCDWLGLGSFFLLLRSFLCFKLRVSNVKYLAAFSLEEDVCKLFLVTLLSALLFQLDLVFYHLNFFI